MNKHYIFRSSVCVLTLLFTVSIPNAVHAQSARANTPSSVQDRITNIRNSICERLADRHRRFGRAVFPPFCSSTTPDPEPHTADITLTKNTSVSTTTVGEVFDYTITVENIGEVSASDVKVTDVLPLGISFVSTTSTTGSYATSTGIWSIGAMPVNSTETLTLTVMTTATGTIENTATGMTSTTETNTQNNTASATIVVEDEVVSPTGAFLITEVYYDAAGDQSEPGNEWVELYNGTSEDIDLTSWSIGDSNTATSTYDSLGTTTVPVGAYIVVTSSTTTLDFWTFPEDTIVIVLESSIGSNGLSNTGDAVFLYKDEVQMDAVSYGSNTDAFDPSAPDVSAGHSIHRTPITEDTDTNVEWEDKETPTPGSA